MCRGFLNHFLFHEEHEVTTNFGIDSRRKTSTKLPILLGEIHIHIYVFEILARPRKVSFSLPVCSRDNVPYTLHLWLVYDFTALYSATNEITYILGRLEWHEKNAF